MKRLPGIAGFFFFLLLCASVTYWAMQWFKPPAREVSAAPPTAEYVPDLAAAAGLFGARMTVTVASNYQLKGVVVAGRPADSVAIIATDGKPAQAIAVNREVADGVKVKQVFRQYVMLEEGGVAKRLDLPADARGQGGAEMATRAPLNAAQPVRNQALTPGLPQAVAPAMPATMVGRPDGGRSLAPLPASGMPQGLTTAPAGVQQGGQPQLQSQ